MERAPDGPMKVSIDNQILHNFQDRTACHPLLASNDTQVHFGWPSLLEYLGLAQIFSEIRFDSNEPLFAACIKTLSAQSEKEVVHYVYDHLFTQTLNQVRALGQIDPASLLQAIKAKRGSGVNPLSLAAFAYEIALEKNGHHTIHDLILYLAWDRMCVRVAHLFNHPSSDPQFIESLSHLKECLIESYEHILANKRTRPSLYRLMESLFFYQMREENIPKHTDEEWTLLSHTFPILKGQDELVDFYYIDNPEQIDYHLTLDTSEIISRRMAFATYMLDQMQTPLGMPDRATIISIDIPKQT
jgi:hypothetical protein